MHLYWYWPFLRSEDIGLAEAVATAPVDNLLVHTLERPGVPRTTINPRVELRNDLPEVADARRWSPTWIGDRARTYLQRRRLRGAETAGTHDLTHVWFLNRFTDVVDIPRLARAGRLVVNVHDVRPHNRRLPDMFGDRMLGRIYRSGTRLVVHHPELRDRLVEGFRVDPRLVSVIPHMVRPRPAVEAPVTRTGDRVLFFGTLRHNKGLDVLLDALRDADPSIRWEVVGRGEPDLESAITAAASRDPRLTATIGRATEQQKAAAFERADLVVLPYRAFESQSGVLHDAYSHGVPVVVTDVGALGRTVHEDGTGAVVPAGDPQALATAVSELLGDDARLARARQAAERVATARSPARIAAQLHSLYAELL